MKHGVRIAKSAGHILLLMCLGWLLAACANPDMSSETRGQVVSENTPDGELYAKINAGVYQLSAVRDTIELLLDDAGALHKKSKNSGFKEALTEVMDYLDGAGATLSSIDLSTPTSSSVKLDPVAAEKRRLETQQAAEDALRDAEEANGIVESIPELLAKEKAEQFADVISVLLKDLREAIVSLGGQVENPEPPQTE